VIPSLCDRLGIWGFGGLERGGGMGRGREEKESLHATPRFFDNLRPPEAAIFYWSNYLIDVSRFSRITNFNMAACNRANDMFTDLKKKQEEAVRALLSGKDV
jgi:hypothetical protein